MEAPTNDLITEEIISTTRNPDGTNAKLTRPTINAYGTSERVGGNDTWRVLWITEL